MLWDYQKIDMDNKHDPFYNPFEDKELAAKQTFNLSDINKFMYTDENDPYRYDLLSNIVRMQIMQYVHLICHKS